MLNIKKFASFDQYGISGSTKNIYTWVVTNSFPNREDTTHNCICLGKWKYKNNSSSCRCNRIFRFIRKRGKYDKKLFVLIFVDGNPFTVKCTPNKKTMNVIKIMVHAAQQERSLYGLDKIETSCRLLWNILLFFILFLPMIE